MIRKATYLLIIICFIYANNPLYAQDVHFSQYANTPFMINPALTGLMCGDFKASIHYRNQWTSFSNGYKTYAFNID